MAKCKMCEQEMQTADSCTYDLIRFRKNGRTSHLRSREHFGEPAGRCTDCGIKHGGIHHFGCDVERCPKCGLQLIGCECQDSTVWFGKSK